MLGFGLSAQQNAEHHVVVVSSSFTLYGTTNLNQFECRLVQDNPTTPMVVRTRKSAYDLAFEGLELTYPIDEFDCGLEAMSHDLRKTLKSSQYPELYLRINEIRIKPETNEVETLQVVSSVTIKIAGVTRHTQIDEGLVINHTEDSLTLTGYQSLAMSDFNIQPPSKFFGMVQVSNELSVGFEIVMDVKTMK